MMPLINGAMLAAGSSLAASVVAKATLAAALGLAGAWLARRSRAAARHVLLTAVFGVLLALPIASMVTPPLRIVVAGPSATAANSPAGPARVAAGGSRVAPQGPGVSRVSAADLLFWAWLAGTALFLTPVAMGLWQVRGLRRSALPWRKGQLLADGLARAAGMRRRVEVLVNGLLVGPMTCGVAHPAIVFSADAEGWAEEDLNRAMVHELEHVRRRDWVTHCVARAVCAAYWFHPLVWMAWRRLELEAERSCDDAVLARSEATAYADQLVGLARQLTAAKSPLLAMAKRDDLAARVGAVLDSGQRRGRAGATPVWLAFAAAAVLVVTMSPLRMVAAPQAAGEEARMSRLLSRSALVMLTVTVTDQNGREVAGLSPGDFVVTEEGVPQRISVFEYRKAADGSISSYYAMGYYARSSDEDGHFRAIGITLKGNSNAKLEYRPGYYTHVVNGAAFSGVPDGGGVAFGPDMRPPALIYKRDAEYSDEARRAKYQGTVVLSMEVGVSGEVNNIRVMRAIGLGLDERAIEAIQQWKFRPGMKDGKPVAVPVQVAIDFRLW